MPREKRRENCSFAKTKNVGKTKQKESREKWREIGTRVQEKWREIGTRVHEKWQENGTRV
jgi:hypothetical protein